MAGVTGAGSGRSKGAQPPAWIDICVSGAQPVTLLCFFYPCRQGRARCAELCGEQPREEAGKPWSPAEMNWPP